MSGAARLRDPKLWLGVATAIVVLALVFQETERTSPGPLTTTHARLPELAGNDGCDRCHGDANDFASGCASCHEAIGAQLATAKGFHGALVGAEVDASHCETCHVEHHGDEARLVDSRAFALAGVADLAQFEHDFVAFALEGAHAELECAACHHNADVLDFAKGETRFLGAEQRCASCHEDPHDGRFDSNCAACHGQRSFTELDNFRHTEAFPLSGRHAGLACEQCHAPGGAFAIEVVGAADYAAPPRACLDCHESPHDRAFVANVAAQLRSTPEASCGECHSAHDGSFASGGAVMRAELHAATGFALDQGHSGVDCASCHASERADFRERHPGGRVDDCASCHESPHGAQFDAPASACTQCHTNEHWAPSRVTAAQHETFELIGAHARAACGDCHAVDDGGVRVYRGAPRACESCHVDAHDGAFGRQLALVASAARDAGGSCGLCHTPTRFDEVAAESFDHSRWTAFALEGAHARAKCEACHARSERPDEHGRRFGRVAALFEGPVGACSSCHADVHRGAFAASDSCAQCHGVESFRPALASFDHAATGFALDGAHAGANCAACHGASPAGGARELGFVAEAHSGPPNACATCHRDPHGGAFAKLVNDVESNDCARCHATSDFANVERATFDHAAETGYPLRGAHAKAACEACHIPFAAPDEFGRRFGRAAGADCASCHVDVHFGQFEIAGRTDCSRCHDAQRPLRKVEFDHQRDSRFALDANHSKLACSACHVPWPTADGKRVVRYKPLGVECADCHGVSGGKR